MPTKKALFEITSNHNTGSIKVYGNNHNVPIVYGFELSDKEKKEFDYYDNPEDLESAMFFRYKGWVYDLSQFERADKNSPFYKHFDGFSNDTFFSGIGVKYTEDNEFIKVYTYYS